MDSIEYNYGTTNNLKSVQELSEKYRCIFEFPYFNIIQTKVFNDVLHSDNAVVISAPTGSGKTVVFELAIIRLLINMENIDNKNFKIIYVAPIKALCEERLDDWHQKFSKLGLSCIVSTGDSENVDFRNLINYNIIITTPEKWDCLTRNPKDNNLFDSVKLFMIDEVHLLNEETRGPNLEVIIARMKILNKNLKINIRFIAVSATIPNIEDISQWLGSENNPAICHKIGEEFRPVKLNKIVLGYPCAVNTMSFKFDINLNYRLPNVLMTYSEGKPTLIFCSTRKGVELTALHLLRNLTLHLTPSQLNTLSSFSTHLTSSSHKQLLCGGIGVYHSGMSPADRSTVHTAFRQGSLPLLVTTSSLALGVNLPAQLVVVKGTRRPQSGRDVEYPETQLLQMIGRAGRPQFDTQATVVIMTTMNDKKKYENMLEGREPIESNLHRHLTEHINAEVVLGTITDIAIALEWLRYTYLYIRVLKNPKYYNIPPHFTKNQIEKRLQDLCQIEINALNKYGMLQIDQIDGFSLSSTNLGTLMANYYLAFNTMKIFTEIKGNESISELLMLISKCQEFSESYLRVNDKKTLNTLNKCKYQQTIRFPLKSTIKTTPMKIYCIIQAIFGSIRIQNPALQQESIKIMRVGEKIAKCLVTYLLHKTKCFFALLNAFILNQCFIANMWENSPYVSRQFPKIGNVLSNMLVSAGKTSFKTLLETSPRDIERIINRAPPMGNDIIESVMHLPFYKIHVQPSEFEKYKIKITITLLNHEDVSQKCTAGQHSYMTLLAGDVDNNILICKKIFHHSMAISKEYIQYIDIILRQNHLIEIYLISDNWVGIDIKENYDIIIKDENISTNITKKIISNQKDITEYFTKDIPKKNIKKKSKPIESENNTNFDLPRNISSTNIVTDCFENNFENFQTENTQNTNFDLQENISSNFDNNQTSYFENFQIENTQNINFDLPENISSNFENIQTENCTNIENKEYGLLLPKNKFNIEDQDFESFSQNLAKKFTQSNVDHASYNVKLPVVAQLEKNIKMKTALNQFKYTPHNKINLSQVNSNINISSTPQKSNLKYTNSQISLIEPISSQNSQTKIIIQKDESISNEELEKFKIFMQNKYKYNTNISSIKPNITELNKHILEKNIEINISSINDENEQETINISSESSEIIEINENFEKKDIEKPYFAKSFREYVQNSIDKLKKSTLVNSHFNYDFGFQEFLMGPLDENSDDNSEKSSLKFENSEIYSQISENNSVPEFKYEPESILCSPEYSPMENPENITFSCSGQLLKKSQEFENSSCNFEENITQNFENIEKDNSFLDNNFINENSDESQIENSEQMTFKIENKMKIIEQYYKSEENSDILPIKRQKLSEPTVNIFPINKNSNKINDTFKNMNSLKEIMSTYGNKYENKITLNKKPETEYIQEPIINEIVKRTAYSYSINQNEESVKMSVTIYEKEEKGLKNDDFSIFQPYTRH